MSFFRHGEIYHFDEGAILADHAVYSELIY
jgi:hypothetical protein